MEEKCMEESKRKINKFVTTIWIFFNFQIKKRIVSEETRYIFAEIW